MGHNTVSDGWNNSSIWFSLMAVVGEKTLPFGMVEEGEVGVNMLLIVFQWKIQLSVDDNLVNFSLHGWQKQESFITIRKRGDSSPMDWCNRTCDGKATDQQLSNVNIWKWLENIGLHIKELWKDQMRWEMFCEGISNARLGVHDQSYLFFLPRGQLGVQLLKSNAWN